MHRHPVQVFGLEAILLRTQKKRQTKIMLGYYYKYQNIYVRSLNLSDMEIIEEMTGR